MGIVILTMHEEALCIYLYLPGPCCTTSTVRRTSFARVLHQLQTTVSESSCVV